MKLLLTTLFITAAAISLTAADDAGSVMITPQLGAKFGKIIEIEGTIVDDTDTHLRAHLGKKLVEVHKVGDMKLEKPTVIELTAFSFTDIKLPKHGTRVKMRGYETGGFTGIPSKAFEDIPRVATTDHHFASCFQITKLLTPSNAEAAPAPAPLQQ